MKSASKIFYIIGLVSNVIMLIIFVLGMVGLIYAQNNPEFSQELANSGVDISLLSGFGFAAVIYLVVANAVVLILTLLALRKDASLLIHIILLAGGIFDFNIFYILGSVFGLIDLKQAE